MSHQLDGLATEQTNVADFAFVEHHLAETSVVHCGGNQSRTRRIVSGIGKRSFLDGSIGKTIQAFVRIISVSRGESVELVGGREEIRIFHSYRFEDSGTKKFVQRFARNDFHQTAEYVDAKAVFEAFAGIEQQRNTGKSLDTVRDRAVIRQQSARYPSTLVHGTEVSIPVVGEPRGVAKQVTNCNFSRGRNRIGLAGGRLYQYFRILELGKVF